MPLLALPLRLRVATVLALIAAAPACHPKPASGETGIGAPDCVEQRARSAQAQKRWHDVTGTPPPRDAPVEVIAAHTAEIAAAAKEIAATFAKASPKDASVAESVQGVRMLGELAAAKLGALADTMRDFGARVARLELLESAANESAPTLSPDTAASLGCGSTPPAGACVDVVAQLAEAVKPSMPSGAAEAAKTSRAKADVLDHLAAAIDALPPAAAQKTARDDLAAKARKAAAAYRALAPALDEVAPLEERVAKEQREGQAAAWRLAAELEAADKLCAPPGSASASAAPPSGRPPHVREDGGLGH